MQDYIIMTDSCCDLTDQMARELELEVLPLTMTMDGKDTPTRWTAVTSPTWSFISAYGPARPLPLPPSTWASSEDAMRTVLGRDRIFCACASRRHCPPPISPP